MIFLSYRRDDVPFAVGLLAARLFEACPPGDVFLDTMANRRVSSSADCYVGRWPGARSWCPS